MKIQRFNESLLNGKNPQEHLIKKYNNETAEYSVKVITERGADLYCGGGAENLDDAVSELLRRKKDREGDNLYNKSYYYILKNTSSISVVPNEEIERLIDAKKYNL